MGSGEEIVENSDNFLTTKIDKPIYGITLFFILGIILGRYLTFPLIQLPHIFQKEQ